MLYNIVSKSYSPCILVHVFEKTSLLYSSKMIKSFASDVGFAVVDDNDDDDGTIITIIITNNNIYIIFFIFVYVYVSLCIYFFKN